MRKKYEAHPMMSRLTAIVAVLLTFILSLSGSTVLYAQEADNTFGGWEHIELAHSFKDSKWYGSIYFEHENYQYQRLDQCFISAGLGYEFTSWLKAGAAYDFLIEPAGIGHRAVAYVTGTLKEGNLSLSLRERYQHKWSIVTSTRGNELRSRLKAQYTIPGSRFKPYVAVEVYSWEKWQKTKHYVGSTITLNDHFELETYYMYYLFANKPAEHVLGIGLNMAF